MQYDDHEEKIRATEKLFSTPPTDNPRENAMLIMNKRGWRLISIDDEDEPDTWVFRKEYNGKVAERYFPCTEVDQLILPEMIIERMLQYEHEVNHMIYN